MSLSIQKKRPLPINLNRGNSLTKDHLVPLSRDCLLLIIVVLSFSLVLSISIQDLIVFSFLYMKSKNNKLPLVPNGKRKRIEVTELCHIYIDEMFSILLSSGTTIELMTWTSFETCFIMKEKSFWEEISLNGCGRKRMKQSSGEEGSKRNEIVDVDEEVVNEFMFPSLSIFFSLLEKSRINMTFSNLYIYIYIRYAYT